MTARSIRRVPARPATAASESARRRWRCAYEQRLGEEIRRARRFDRPLAVAVLDLVQFAARNRALDQLAAGRALRELADRLRAQLRAHDVVARFCADEFCVLMPDTSVDAAHVALERMAGALHSLSPPVSASPPCALGVGLSVLEPGDDVATLVKRAQDALEAAKHHGDGGR